MPMIKCPTCKGDIAKDAEVCPHCGHPLVVKEKKDKESVVLLKRDYVSYKLDILLIALPYLLILLMLLNKYLIFLAIPVALLCTGWGILSIRKKKLNNKIIKDLVYYNKENKEITVYDLNLKEYKTSPNLVIKILKENFITTRVYITIKLVNEDQVTYSTKKIELGYAKTSDVKTFKTKLKNIVDVDMSVEV